MSKPRDQTGKVKVRDVSEGGIRRMTQAQIRGKKVFICAEPTGALSVGDKWHQGSVHYALFFSAEETYVRTVRNGRVTWWRYPTK